MFKIQYPTDHLKKEEVNSKTTELSDEAQYIEQAREFSQLKRYRRSDVDSESGSQIKRIDVPGDGSCLFWSVTMAYLIPVRNDDALFRQRYEVLFGNEGAVIQNLDRIRNLVRNLSTANYDDTFANLVRNVFRNRVVDHISSHESEFRNFVEGESGLSFKGYLENMRKLNTWGGEPEIRAMSGMLSATISVSGEVRLPPYGDGNIQIQLFHVGAPGNRNHYNFGLERGTVDNDVELVKGLKKVMGKGRPQDFELIQLLIEEAGKEVGISRQDEDFKSFEPRFQSFVDQIPSYLHSVEKAGFFTHFFLGSFSTLLDTEIAKKLDIKEIYFSFDGAKTLKVAIIKNGEIKSKKNVIDKVKLFVISESGSHSYTQEFDQGELKEVLGRYYSFIENNLDEIKVKSIEIIKDASYQEKIVVDVKDKEVDVEHDSAVQFKKVRKGIWRNPEVDIAKLAISNQRTVKASLRRILDKIYTIHSEYADSLIYASRAREAAHHGFMVGVFMNFHYRYNLRVYPEQFAGRGYADIILLARGPDRALDSIPIIIELKAGAGTNATPDKALQQAEKYAQGFQPNVQRVLTTADNILCVGVNLDNPSPISDIKVSNRGEEIIPLFQDMLKSSDDWDTQEIGKRELKEQIKDNMERIYHTFPGTSEKGDNHYFSRFLLGQSLLLSEDSGTSLKKYIFIYGDNIPTEVHPNLRGLGRPAAQRARERLSANLDASHAVVTMVLIPENTEKLVYVMNIVEANRKDVLNGLNEVLPLDRLNREIGNREIIELSLNFDTRYKSDFKRYLTIWAEKYNSLQEYNNGAERFQGTFKEVPYPNELKETFDRALDIQSLSIGGYSRLLEKIGEGIFPFKSFVNKEAHFQGILNGAFSYYSDLKLQESPETRALVLTEFQTGRGERIDMLVHGIKFVAQGGNAEEYTPIGLELKTSRQGKGAKALLREANDQINEEYKKGVTYKTLTDGDEVKFIGVVFDKGSNNPNKLILTSRTAKEGFIPVGVVHSSVHMLPACSKGKKRGPSSPEYPPSKKQRRERSVSMACIDSFDEEKITEEEKEQRIKELFNADKVAERVKNIEFYDQLFKVSQKISEGEIIDRNVEEAFVAKIKDLDLGSIDPEIRDIVKEMKDNIENKEEVKNILRRSGVAEKIGKVAEGAGLAFTAFLVGKHIANGDIEGLGYDALNLWVMPKIGEKISGKILELGTKLDSQMLKGFAPAMGRAIGNFAAFLGLAESIKARQNATDPVDIKITDLNIATNSIFIAADVPAVVTETMSAIGMEAGVIGEFAGPVGAAISVAVIIIAQFVEAGLEVEKLEEHIKLTDQEKHDLYWDFFLGKKVPDYIGNDLQTEEIYKQYISKILNQFKNNYDTIAISLPSILVTKEEYATSARSRDKRQWEGYGLAFGQALHGVSNECRAKTRIVDDTFDFESSTNITYPFYTSGIKHNSRIIPSTVENYNVVCGPCGDDIAVEIVSKKTLANLPDGKSCSSASQYNNMKLSRTVERWLLQEHLSNCYNAVVYENKNSRRYGSVYYIPARNANINVVFQEKDILNGDRDRRDKVENRYYFEKSLDSCKVHNPGSNFFYITGKFSCDLGADGQKNIVITQGNLTTDSINIHSIIGSNKANHIKVSYADYVDGKGGNDVITIKNFTTIKGYFGDSIYGKGLVLLPINFNDVGNITHVNNITNIYNKSGAFISVDKQTSVKTADGLFVTPTKIDDKTGVVTNLHVTKSLSGDVVLDDELDNLRKIDDSNFNITKQLSSANYHSAIGSSSNHIFYPDKEHHNFYWEAPSNISHLYLFDNRNANITIAQANGILDFSQLNCTLDDIPFIENKKGEIKINKNGLNVTLLPDYKDVTVTFDGQEYYKLQDGELERDYCSHSLKIDGRFSVNGTDLLNHHNCFTFDSEKVLFLKLNNNLLLLSDKGALSISDYYSSVHKNWDLSIGLNNRIMEPEEFGERADSFSSFRYYQPGEQGLQIYHNQPINKNDIGLVDLKGKSILDFDMKVMNDTLLLSHKNNTLVKVENWNTYQPAREMIFAFNDTVVSNAKCIASTCNSEDVVLSFNKEKVILLKEQVFNAIVRDNIDEAKDLIRKIESLNTDGKHELTPLSLAIKEGRLDIVHILFDQQHFTLGDIDIDGCTPLSLAAQEGSLSIAEFFLNEGGYIFDGENPCGTPVRIAARNGNIQMLELLFNKDLNIQIQLSTLSGMIWLIQNIEEEFSNQTDISSNAKIWIKSFIEKLKDSMKGLAKRKLEQDMLDGCSYLSSNLSSEIDKFDKELLNEIITNVIEDMYGRVDMKKMLNCVYSYGSSDQSILGPMAVFDTMKTRGDLNNAVFKLAHWIKEEMDFYKYNSTSTKEESDLEMLKNQLPESVRNVVFALQVCIRNVEYRRYLYSPNDDCMYHLNSCDTNRRYAFTWPSNGGGNNFKWKVELNGDNVYLKNVEYRRYLYSPNDDCMYHLNSCDTNRRYAFTWPSNGRGNNFKWKVELNGDNVYLKNVEYGRYLYSPNDDCMYHLNNCDTDRRYVFTWKSREGVTNDGVWRIEDCSSTRKRRDIELEDRISSDSSSFEDVGSEDFDEVQNFTVYKNSMRTLPDITRGKGHVKYLEEKFEEENREHHRHNHLSHKPPAIDSSNQPEIAASSGTRASSWVNDLFGWVKSSIGGLLSSKPVGISSTKDSISQVDGQFAKASVSNSSPTSTTLSSDGTDKKQESNYFTSGGFSRDNIDYVNANIKQMRERQTPVKFKPSGGNTILEMGDHYLSQVDFNGTIMLLDLLIRKATGQKYISTVDQSISPLEAQGYALNITKGFEKVVEQAGLKSGVSMHRLNIDYMGMQKEITRKVMSGKFNEISGILKSYVEKACPGEEAGKLSSKKFDKFIAQFNKGLLNQSIEQVLHNGDGTLEVDGVKKQQMSLEPQSYLSNASIQSHSKDKVSTCLSDIGVTKLGNTLSK